MPNTNPSKIIKTDINLGKLPYFEIDEQGNYIEEQHGNHHPRVLKYHSDQVVSSFPFLSHPLRIKETMQFNLYLIERYNGNFSLSKNKHSANDNYVWSRGHLGANKGKGIKLSSISSIAKDLKMYLDWMIDNKISYEEIMAVPLNYDPNTVDEAETLLPVWRFREHIKKLIKFKKLSFSVGDRTINSIKAFYLWSFRRAEVNALPFSIKLKAISKPRKDNTNAIFSMPGTKPEHKRAVQNYISNLKLSNNDKPKDDKPRQGLQAYTGEELKLLMTTKTYSHRTYGLFLRCCLMAGLRSNEVIQINHDEIPNPNMKRVSFSLALIRKFDKATNLRISPRLIMMLWEYTQTNTYKKRQLKHEITYGKDNPKHPLPLFINRDGERMKEESVQNTIQKVRADLKRMGLPILERDLHDLRATFATYWAIAMLKKGYSPNDIKAKLMLMLSHEDFRTTQLYLDFAIEGTVGKHGAMDEWVVDIYQEVMNRVEEAIKVEVEA